MTGNLFEWFTSRNEWPC